jgi:hypothetical protein
VLHHPSANAVILHRRIDRDRADAVDRRPLVHEIAAGDTAVELGDDRMMAGMGEQHHRKSDPIFRRWEVRREVVRRAHRLEGLVADRAACHGIDRRT